MASYDTIDSILSALPTQYDSTDFLTKAAIQLPILMHNLANNVARAKLAESEAVLNHLQGLKEDGKKVTVAEAERRAIVDTQNEYERLKLEWDSLLEVILSIKKRLDTLTQLARAGI